MGARIEEFPLMDFNCCSDVPPEFGKGPEMGGAEVGGIDTLSTPVPPL